MQLIPLQAVPNQTVSCQLAGQQCLIKVYARRYGLFVDLYLNGSLLIGGVIAENLNRIVRSTYLGFQGDLIFADSQGASDPVWTGLGSQYELLYLSAADLTTLWLVG